MPDSVIKLAKFVHDLRFSNLDRPVVDQTLRVIRDTLGTMLAGATLPEVKGLVDLASTLGGPGQATLMGQSQTTSPHVAAMVNGTGAVSLELDEGNQYAINHPAVHILPATLALAEERQASGRALLTAFVAGYEVAVRVGRATRLREPVHPFGTHAIVGTAAAAAYLLKLNLAEIAQTLELAAGITIASSQTAANSGASVRNLVTGLTNHNGLLAPLLAQAGLSGEPQAFQAVFGRVLGDAFKDDDLGHDLGHDYYITRNYFKRHACSRWNHAPIEAVAALLARHPFRAEDVAEIIVRTYDPATRLSWSEPVNGYAAKHSIPYNVAARVVLGSNGLEAYTEETVQDPRLRALEAYTEETVQDPRLRALAKRITIREDPALTAKLPEVRPAQVEVKLRSGMMLSETIERPRGGFDNPLTEAELVDKFQRLAGLLLSEKSVVALETLLPSLPELSDLSALSHLLRG
jgi:2-methylcitrate dehydratase PrpD